MDYDENHIIIYYHDSIPETPISTIEYHKSKIDSICKQLNRIRKQ